MKTLLVAVALLVVPAVVAIGGTVGCSSCHVKLRAPSDTSWNGTIHISK
jgi:hypothetical protein